MQGLQCAGSGGVGTRRGDRPVACRIAATIHLHLRGASWSCSSVEMDAEQRAGDDSVDDDDDHDHHKQEK